MRFIRPRSGFIFAAILVLAAVCGTSLGAFAASNTASATLRISVNVVPTLENATRAPQKTASDINFAIFRPSAVTNLIEIRPLPSEAMRDMLLKTNASGQNPAPAVLQTTTIVLQ